MVIGITGGIGSGKSTLAQRIAKEGFILYDTDKEAKRLIVEDPHVRASITALLGADVYKGEQYLTHVVAQRVFARPELLQQLNAIVHPAVKKDIEDTLLRHPDTPMLLESALLFESGLDQLCDKTICITAPEEVRIARTIARDHTTEQKVRDRIAAQMKEEERCKRADYVYENIGPIRDDTVRDVIWSSPGKPAR